jgi:hypothetical protein
MSSRFDLRHLKNLGDRLSVSIRNDDKGFVGRECPIKECLGYFKVRPGTGLSGDIDCHCPYCGHAGKPNTFWTPDQIAYARSVARRTLTEAFRKDLKSWEFEHKARGPFGFGVSLKLKRAPSLPQIHEYSELPLETEVTCDSCTLEYAIYGLFGHCPDCGIHNSLQMLERNFALIRKQMQLAETLEVQDSELARQVMEDALENCVSALDGFGKELCRTRADKSSEPKKARRLSFQRLNEAADQALALFGVDMRLSMLSEEWLVVHRLFMKRHVISHCSGVADAEYVAKANDPAAVVGRRVTFTRAEIEQVLQHLSKLGAYLVTALPQL